VSWLAEFLLFSSYCLGSVGPWALYALGMRTGLRRLDLLRRSSAPQAHQSPATVLAIIPARNEQRHIRACTESLLAQTGVNLRLLVVNDGSTDDTPAILNHIAQQDPRLTVIHLPASDVPAGWTGKCRAIVRGMREFGDTSAFDFLLFIDSDTTFEPQATELAVRLARFGREGDDHDAHGLVSLLPRQAVHTLSERAMVPLVAATVMGAFGVAYANNDHMKRHAFGCGQFMLFRRDTYLAIGGHESVKGDLAEDVELARKVKNLGGRPRVALAADLGVVHQHEGLKPLLRQWARNLYGNRHGRPWTLLGPLAFVFFQAALFIAALGWTLHRWRSPPATGIAEALGWTAAVTTQAVVVALMLGLTYRAQRLPWRSAASALLGVPLLIWTLLMALGYCVTGQVSWRGRRIGKESLRPLDAEPASE
jgi:glycosyltransferase involved in cell wall biosynthesis